MSISTPVPEQVQKQVLKPVQKIEPVWIRELECPDIELISISGRTLYKGKIDELNLLASEGAFTENGFEWTQTTE